MTRARNWPCPYCGRRFVAEKSMQRHINLGCGDAHRWQRSVVSTLTRTKDGRQ